MAPSIKIAIEAGGAQPGCNKTAKLSIDSLLVEAYQKRRRSHSCKDLIAHPREISFANREFTPQLDSNAVKNFVPVFCFGLPE